MLAALRRRLADSELFSYNQVRRDRWIARQAAALPAGSRVIDIGAGSCPYRAHFAHCSYVCDAASVPAADGSFDAILCSEVLEHYPAPIDLLREFARLLAPGGKLILTAPLGSGIHQEPYHFYGGYTPYWYEKFLAAAGFSAPSIEANEGSLRTYAQESIRFLRNTRPFRLGMPLLAELLWAPVWLLLLPLLGVFVSIACKLMDRYDKEQRTTVGYHVTATRLGR